MTQITRKCIVGFATLFAVAVLACAGKSLRPGESVPLKDRAGKTFGTRYQVTETTERLVLDTDQNGTPEKQYVFSDDVLTSSEHYYPDGKIKVRTFYMRGKANRSEVYRPDGSLHGMAYHNGQEVVDSVDLPDRKRRVEFLPNQ